MIDVGQLVPLADVQIVKVIGTPDEARCCLCTRVLEEPECAGQFVHEQIEIAVAINVGKLRTRHVQSAQKRQ